ncbi:MAG: PEP-CTERM sorting domain-containing protein [Planctomycetota bacterium]
MLFNLLRNLVFSTTFLVFLPQVNADFVFLHEGNNDPTTEGWILNLTGSGNSVGSVTNDLGIGIDAWFTDDDTTSGSNVAAYTATPSAAQIAAGNLNGWTLSANLRVVDIPDAVDSSVIVLYRDGTTSWEMNFGTEADGDTIVQLSGGGQYTLQGTGTGYHQFDLVYDSATSSADLLVNGLEVISNNTGSLSASSGAVAWGAGSTAGTGHGNFASVSFSTVPEPSSIILLGIGMSVWAFRRRGISSGRQSG